MVKNLNKLYEKRSNTGIIYVSLDTKASFNDNFTRPKGDLLMQETDTCKKYGNVAYSIIFDKLVGFFSLYIFKIDRTFIR